MHKWLPAKRIMILLRNVNRVTWADSGLYDGSFLLYAVQTLKGTYIYHVYWATMNMMTDPWTAYRQNPVCGWILMMISLNWISWIKSHQLTGICFLSCDDFMNIFPLKLFILIWDTMNYLFIVNVVVASSQQVKCFTLLPPWRHSKHPLSCHSAYVMLGQLCNVTMGRWPCHW